MYPKSVSKQRRHTLSFFLFRCFQFSRFLIEISSCCCCGITENQVYITNRCNLIPQTPRLFLPAFLSSWWLREEKINPKSQSHSKAWERRAGRLNKDGNGARIEIRRSVAIKRRQNWHKISLSWSHCEGTISPSTEKSIETLDVVLPERSRGWIPNLICGMLIASLLRRLSSVNAGETSQI